MKKYRKEEVIQQVCIAITCDKCKKEYDDIMEMQEFLHYVNDAGYGSVMGDGNKLRLDLCQYCTNELLGPFIRIEDNYISGHTVDSNELEDLFEEFTKASSFKDDKGE